MFPLKPLSLSAARYATTSFFYGFPDNIWENTPSTVSKSLMTLFSKRYLKNKNTSLIVCANCLQKKQMLKWKSQKAKHFFWRQLPLKKGKFHKFGVKKPIWQPWLAPKVLEVNSTSPHHKDIENDQKIFFHVTAGNVKFAVSQWPNFQPLNFLCETRLYRGNAVLEIL